MRTWALPDCALLHRDHGDEPKLKEEFQPREGRGRGEKPHTKKGLIQI